MIPLTKGQVKKEDRIRRTEIYSALGSTSTWSYAGSEKQMVLGIYATSICVILYLQVCVAVPFTGQVLNHFFHDQPTLQVDFCQIPWQPRHVHNIFLGAMCKAKPEGFPCVSNMQSINSFNTQIRRRHFGQRDGKTRQRKKEVLRANIGFHSTK